MKKLVVLFAALMLAAPHTYASGDKEHHTSDVDVDVDVGGSTVNVQGGDMTGGPVSVSTGGNKSFALGVPGLGDVDIAGCLGSEQWTLLIGGRQVLVINWVCLTEFYLRNGQAELAAQALCNTEVIKEYDSEQECEEAHAFFADVVAASMATEEAEEEEPEFYEEQRTLNMALQSEIEQLRELYERRPTPKPVQHTVVEQKPLLTDDQKARLREVVQ